MDSVSHPCDSQCDTNGFSPRYTIKTINNNSHNYDNNNDNEQSNALRQCSDETAVRPVSEI